MKAVILSGSKLDVTYAVIQHLTNVDEQSSPIPPKPAKAVSSTDTPAKPVTKATKTPVKAAEPAKTVVAAVPDVGHKSLTTDTAAVMSFMKSNYWNPKIRTGQAAKALALNPKGMSTKEFCELMNLADGRQGVAGFNGLNGAFSLNCAMHGFSQDTLLVQLDKKDKKWKMSPLFRKAVLNAKD